jgi:hypothetical protein
METSINVLTRWTAEPATKTQISDNTIYYKLTAFADSQAHSKTLWYLVSMIAQGVLFLPIPAVLLYYFNAPIIVLGITMTLFFANIIAGMGGAGIRVLMLLFAISVAVHVLMLAIFIL